MAVTVQKYNTMGLKLGNADIDLRVETSAAGMYVALMTTTHTFDASNSVWADVCANQIGTNNGYTIFNNPAAPNGGRLLTTVTWTVAGSVATYDASDTIWSATGGSIPDTSAAAHAVMISVGSTVGDILLNIDFGQNEQAGDGTDFKITWNASGIFTVT